MKKLIVCFSVCLLGAFAHHFAGATEPNPVNAVSVEQKVGVYINNIYGQIDFGKDTLAFEPFEKAYRGYMNLRNAGKLSSDKQLLSICDFSKSSNDYRFWIIDLEKRKVLYHTYVAHGQGSGDEFATAFSNKMNSHQSSLGFYVTGETYMGEHGLSLRLDGMDNGFNSAAMERGVVVHGAEYVSNNFIKGNQRLGRSWGCPAVPANLSTPIINTIKEGTCLFIYYPMKNYLAKSYWLNKKIESLPEDFGMQTLPLASNVIAKPQPKIEIVSADSFAKSNHYYQVIEKL